MWSQPETLSPRFPHFGPGQFLTIVVVFAGLAIVEGNIVRTAVTVTALVVDEDVAILTVVDLSGFAIRSNTSTETKFFGQFLGEQIIVLEELPAERKQQLAGEPPKSLELRQLTE
ncbi:hypothetical protein HBI27_094810 [Parastagonospora nodorum]|nr:hypothetical protein HBI27_094810 [Parastagonospora nodorum]